jgi:cytochrome c biogenesis protein CcmG, thiol:disulfide interchange protein DsbE
MSGTPEVKSPVRSRLLVFLPAILFSVVAVIALMQLLSGRDIAAVPSALIGKPVPLAELGTLPDMPAYNPEMPGKVTIVNVWASWCAPCREENATLLELTKDQRFEVAGINYKDQPENALAFLKTLGNPFDKIGTDEKGRAAIDWGVYGVPETFIVSRDGLIAYKHVGPLKPEDMAGAFGQALKEAIAK